MLQVSGEQVLTNAGRVNMGHIVQQKMQITDIDYALIVEWEHIPGQQ